MGGDIYFQCSDLFKARLHGEMGFLSLRKRHSSKK